MEILIGMEATGHCWLAVYFFLLDHGFSVVVLNPIQTNAWRKGTEIRKRKVLVVLDQIFSKYQSIFSNVFGKTSSQLLLEYFLPSDYEQIAINDFSRNRLVKKTAGKLME